MVKAVAALIAVQVTQNMQLAQFWEAERVRELINSKYQDAQSQPHNVPQFNQPFAAHYGL